MIWRWKARGARETRVPTRATSDTTQASPGAATHGRGRFWIDRTGSCQAGSDVRAMSEAFGDELDAAGVSRSQPLGDTAREAPRAGGIGLAVFDRWAALWP